MLQEVAHPDGGVIAKVRSTNESLLRSMTARTQQIDDLLGRLERQVWATWLPVVASAALALGFLLGTWFANERQATPETPSAAQAQRCLRLPMHRPRRFRSDVQSTIEEITSPGSSKRFMPDIWFTADFHFGHSNIIRYCNRPFRNAEEMDQTILEHLNASVKANDILYFLGDFCIGSKARVLEHRKQIRCKKVFAVPGNHDKEARKLTEGLLGLAT